MLGTRLIRVDGKPARVLSDQAVTLTPEQRQDRDAVQETRKALFGD